MGRHEAGTRHDNPGNGGSPTRKRHLTRTLGRHAMHPVTHILMLLALHVVALGILDKTPLLTLLSLQ